MGIMNMPLCFKFIWLIKKKKRRRKKRKEMIQTEIPELGKLYNNLKIGYISSQ